MLKWLRSCFAWRFGLMRLLIAIIFLGVCVGLNCQKIGPVFVDDTLGDWWGWPLPAVLVPPIADRIETESTPALETEEALKWLRAAQFATSYELPWTHRGYLLAKWPITYCALLNAIVAIIPLSLILFLQIPRRKVAAREGE